MKGHYFSREEPEQSDPQIFSYVFNENRYIFSTDTGVFSVGKMDSATDTLMKNIPPLSGSLLDMGCGYGAMGIILAKEYNLTLYQADINPRALRLTAENAAKNGVMSNIAASDCFKQIQGFFDTVVINPPIHAGKNVIFEMYEGAYKHLHLGGSLYIVILKKHGAESSIKYLNKIFGNCHVQYKKRGCYVLKSIR